MSSVFEFHIVGTDVLSDTAGFTGNHIGITNVVEQRRFTVVHVTHHRHHRRSAHEVFRLILLLMDLFSHVGTLVFGGKAKFFSHDIDGFGIQALINRHHHANAHTRANHLIDRHIHHCGEVVSGHKLREFQDS